MIKVENIEEKSCDNCLYSIPDCTNVCNPDHYCSNEESEEYGYNAEYLNGCDEWKSIEPNLGNTGSICTKTGGNDEDRTTDDLISRKMAIDGIKKEILERDGRFYKGLLVANHVILHLPPAQPERKKGKWLVDEDGNMECPFCGNTCGFGNYCNECGADMRGIDNG